MDKEKGNERVPCGQKVIVSPVDKVMSSPVDKVMSSPVDEGNKGKGPLWTESPVDKVSGTSTGQDNAASVERGDSSLRPRDPNFLPRASFPSRGLGDTVLTAFSTLCFRLFPEKGEEATLKRKPISK